MPEEEGFQVIDKRRVGRETGGEPPAPDTTAPAAEVAAGSESTPGTSSAAEASAAGTEAAGTISAATGEPDEAEDEEFAEPGGEPAMGPTSAVDLVQMCIGMLNEIAWVKMGLVADPMSGEVASDPPQARLAIDCVGDLVHRLEPHVDGRVHRDLQTLVQNLKVNYVRRGSAGG